MNFHRFRVAVSAVAILFAGCDFYRNLVDDHTVTQSTLSLKVLDGWTHEPVPFAVCMDVNRNVTLNADEFGNAMLKKVGTGNYDFTCSSPDYYEVETQFGLGKESASITVSLARLGGPNWYPGRPELQVSVLKIAGIFDRKNSTLRVPGQLLLQAGLHDSSGAFHYVWKSSRFPAILNRESTHPFAKLPYYWASLNSLPTDSVQDTITLIVMAHPGFKGEFGNEYVVDSISLPILWVRNTPPKFNRVSGNGNVKIGCPDRDEKFQVKVSAIDLDGHCDSIVVSSSDPTSIFGNHKIREACYENSLGYINFPVSESFLYDKSQALNLLSNDTAFIKVTAWDDNKQSRDTILKSVPIYQGLPVDSLQITDNKLVHFVNEPIEFRFWAEVNANGLKNLKVNWGDGTNPSVYNLDLDAELLNKKEFLSSHQFLKPGDFKISSVVTDFCGDSASASLSSPIHIRLDSKPVLTVIPPSILTAAAAQNINLRISVSDPDLADHQDKLLLRIFWGDSTSTLDSTTNPGGFSKNFPHSFFFPNPNSTFQIVVQLEDAHFEISDTTFVVSRPK